MMSGGGGGQFTVEISGISDISSAEIEVHFQKRKYGGGDVTVKNLEDGKAVMTIEGITPEMHKKILESKHIIDGEELSLNQIAPATEPVTELLPPLISDSGTVVVRGFQQPIHKEVLELYFTHEAKSGGGPIDEIVIKEKEVFIVFTDQAIAVRVAERGHHMIVGQQVEVQLVVSEPATGEQLHTVTSANTLLVRGLDPQYHGKETLDLYFSNQTRCGGGDITEIIVKDTEAYITYAEPGVAARVAKRSQHNVLGCKVEVQLLVSEAVTEQLWDTTTSTSDTILVKGLNPECRDKFMLELYFSNQTKCGGGKIAEVVVKDNEAYITYAESGVAARVAEERQYSILGHKVEVQLVSAASITKPLALPQVSTILVKGLRDCHTESALRLFFSNKRKCGGGDITNVVIKKEIAYVTFADQKVAAGVAEKKVFPIMGHSVEVALFTGTFEDDAHDIPTSCVSDSVLILGNVPSSMSDGMLMLYIDNITELDGEKNDYSIDRNDAEVVITFNAPLDVHRFPAGLDDLIPKIISSPYEGTVLQARRPLVLTSSILIDNLPTNKCNEELLDVYFTNKKRSGIDSYKQIEILDEKRAIVHLESEDDMLQSVKHDHSWLGSDVVVTECKAPMAVSPSSSVYTSTTKTPNKKVVMQNAFDIKVSKPFVNCLKKNQEKVEKQLNHLHATVSANTETEQVTISPCSGSEDLKDWEEKCQSIINSYLQSLVTETVSFPSEIKDIMVPFILDIIQNHLSLHIEYDANSLKVAVVGEKIMVGKVKGKLEEALDSHMMKKESLPFEDQKFLSFLHVKLDGLLANHPKIEATLQADEGCVSIQGTKDSRIAFKKDLESLRTSIIPVTVRISKDFVEFLSAPLGRTLLHQYLQGFELRVAIYFGPESTLLLLCSQKNDGIKAAKVIQESVCSTCVPYPEVFITSLRGKEWATLKSDVEESYCVSVSNLGNKVRIIGDKKSLDHVSEEIQQFIEKECHIEKSIPLCGAQWRLLTTHMNKKWNKMEQKLKDQSKVKFSFPNEGDIKSSIVLKGEKPVVADLAKQVEDLIASICTCPPLEQARPGTVKFFYSEKGKTLITGVEAQEKSCIQLEVLDDGDGDDLSENGVAKVGISKLGMGTTKEGKIITLVKGDITEIPVDVIVNASNADLKHIGGVALAIANKGGPIIQKESDCRTRREGKLSDGDAIMMKEVGKLPCKRLIHAVGPKWNSGYSKEEAFLKRACLESLKLARNFKTVSFPAISSGVFGFPINKCATCMVKAFMEYSKIDPMSSLHEITIIVRDQPAIDAFGREMSQHLENFHGTSTSFVKVNPGDSGVNDDFKPVHGKRKKPSVKTVSQEDQSIFAQFIKLYKGELLKHTADVYVNTAGDNLNLRQGAVAASFLKAGGQSLQDECTAYVSKNGRVPCGEVVVTGPGAIRCSNIIHTVGPVYNGKASEKILQDLVQKCLETCDKLRASTIAFPALGAGNLSYPQHIVADIMVSTIAGYFKANRTTTHIKTVKLVIFMDNTYAEFNKLLSSRPSFTGSSTVQESSYDVENLSPAEAFHPTRVYKRPPKSARTHSSTAEIFTAGSVKVEILQGDITEDDSDAIVNTTNAEMKLVGFGVAGAILRKGGPELQVICDTLVSQGFRLQEGKVCDTPSTGSLKCFKILHVVVPQNDKHLLGKTIIACLKRAEKLQLNSIAFPAIGTGTLGYSLEEAAQGICSSIIAFGQKANPIYVKRVRIIIFQQEMYRSFKDKFTEVTNKPGILKRMGNAVMSLIYGDGSSEVAKEPVSGSETEPVVVPHSPTPVLKITEKSVLLIQIYAEDKQKVTKTEERLQRIIEDQFTNEKVPNELVSKFSQKQRDDLERKAKQKHVQIIIETGADLSYIQLKGDRTDVADLKFDIQEIIHQISSVESIKREAELLQAKVRWQWLTDPGDYEDYDELPNYHIENAYKQSKKRFTYTSEGVSEVFDFSKMEADDGQGVVKIKRVDIEDQLKEVESPGKWDPMPKGVVCHVVALTPNTPEYNEVKSKFEKTMPSLQHTTPVYPSHSKANIMLSHPQYSGQYNQIVKIERIQNPFLHGQYVAKKKTMDKHNPSNTTNERELFHGCPGDVAEKISHHGFNRSFAGKNATVYGRGVYFAHDASYSARDQYSPRDANNNKHIFLAKVLTGDFAVGSSNYVTPPPKGASSLTLYDSVVDNVSNPSIFVIFGDAQAYPDYHITFT